MTGKKKKKLVVIGIVVALVALLAITGVVIVEVMENSRYKMAGLDKNFHSELFGENVYIFTPKDDPEEVNALLQEIYNKQETNQFGEERYGIYFMPGEYDESIEVNVGYYMQVAGLGVMPTDTKIESLQCTARWLGDDPNNHNACCNFWRGVENISLGSNTMWAVSQATFMRRTQVDGALYLHDEYGWCSGGFLADSNSELMTDSGSQQQWLSRNCNWKAWMGSNWNMVFVGIQEGKAPVGTWPGVPYTEIETTEWIQEKPFLIYDEKEGFQIFVPEVRENSTGVSWEGGAEGTRIPITDFYVAKAGVDNAQTMNQALADGKHLFLTPGIYPLEEPVQVTRPDTIVLGTGLATLVSQNGNACMETADVSGLIIAGILFDAGETEAENLMVVGSDAAKAAETAVVSQSATQPGNFITLSDLFFRVGGTATALPTKVKQCVTLNSDNIVGDNFWVWRADHGDQVAWDKNTADTGIVVNGDNVTMYALMVEHFEKYQTVWNGENGKVYMYQSEIPYDVPNQSVWMSHDGTQEGYASFYVNPGVQKFEAHGLGIYLYNRDTEVMLHTAMEVPKRQGVKVRNICTVMLNGHPGMRHIINDEGEAVMELSERQIICEYEGGKIK